MKLFHLVNLRSANVGNGALTLGVEGLIKEDFGSPPPLTPPHNLRTAFGLLGEGKNVLFDRLAWDDYSFGLKPFDETFVDLINSSDGMIVGGAVALHGRPYCVNAGMRFDLPLHLWDKIKKPLVFYGLSHRHWKGKTYHHADKLKATFDVILSRDDMILGLRNDGTREWLRDTLGIESERFHIVPDPAVFVPTEQGYYPEIEKDKRNVILAFNDEDREDRYGSPERRMAVIHALARAMEKVLAHGDINLILAAHYFDDNRMMADFIDACQPAIAHQTMVMVGSTRLQGCPYFYGRYLQADMAISMRVHSMSPSIGLGVPMVPLITQERMVDFLRNVGLDDLVVDAFALDMTERLVGAVEKTLAERDKVKARFAKAKAQMREEARVFNGKVRALFNG